MSIIIKNYWRFFKNNYYQSYLKQKNLRQKPLNNIKKIQWYRLKKLLDFVYEHNDFYKEYFENENLTPQDIKKPSDMEKLPTTKKETYTKYFDKIKSKGLSKVDFITATTSGSTGKPFCHYMDKKREIPPTYMSFILNKEMMGIEPFEKDNELRIHFHPPNEIKDFNKPRKKNIKEQIMYTFFPEIIGLRSINVKPENADHIKNIIVENDIKIIYGFPSSILTIARFFSKKNIEDFKLKAIITFGENLLEGQRSFISKVFKCPVFMDYGSSECMRMGFECKNHKGFHMDIYNYYFEYINKKTHGRKTIANLVATNLNNYVFPFIRYETNDDILFSNLQSEEVCSINLPIIEKIVGRRNNVITSPSGQTFSSVTFSAFFEDYQKKNPSIKQFQVIKKKDDSLQVKIVTSDEDTKVITKDIEKELKSELDTTMNISVIIVDHIDPEPSGKTKDLIIEQ